jgi:WD40 repeat protein
MTVDSDARLTDTTESRHAVYSGGMEGQPVEMEFTLNLWFAARIGRVACAWIAFLACYGGMSPRPVLAEDFRAHAVLRPQVRSQDDHPPVISALAFHPNGKLLFAAGDDHVLRVWNTLDQTIVATLYGHTDWVRSICVLDGGNRLLTVADDGKLIQWDWQQDRHRVLLEVPHALRTLAVAQKSGRIATAGFETPVYVFDRQSERVSLEINVACRDIRALAISPDEDLIAAGGRDGKVYIISAYTGNILSSHTAHGRALRAVVFDTSGERVITGGDDRSLCVWDVGDGRELMHLQSGSAKTMALCMLGPDRVASAGSDNLIRIWDLQLRSEITRSEVHTGSITVLAAHDTLLASGGFDAAVRVSYLPDDRQFRTAKKREIDSER